MRWPFSLLFRGDRDAATVADAAAAVPPDAPGAATDPPGPTGASVRPAAWSGLPPVQRATGGIALTAPTAAFVRDLAGSQAPAPILRPLAHDLVPDGPAGLVSGIATPLAAAAPPAVVAATAPSAGLPAPRALQRRARTTSVAAPPARRPGVESPEPGLEPGQGSALALPGGSRELPVVARSLAAPALAATRVAPASAPEPARALAPVAGLPVQRSGPAGATDGSTAAPGSAVPAAPGAAGPAATPAPGAPPTGLPSPDDAVAGGPDALPALQRRTLGESRRLGLGVPLAARPPSLEAPGSGPSLPLTRGARSEPPPSPASAAPPPRPATSAPAALPVLRPATAASAEPTPAGVAPTGAGAADVVARAEGGGVAPGSVLQRSADLPLVGDPARRTTSAPVGGPGDAEEGAAAAGEGGELALAPGPDGGGPVPALPAAAPGPVARDAPPSWKGEAVAVSAATAGAFPPASSPGGPDAAAPRPGAVVATAPLVVARSMRGSAPSLRSTVAGVPEGPSPVPAQRGAGAARDAAPPGPQAGLRVPGPSRAGSSAASRVTAPAGVPLQRAPRGVVHEPAPASVSSWSTDPGLADDGAPGQFGRPPVARPGGTSGAGATAAAEPLVVARSASAGGSPGAPPRPPATVLGWSVAGFAPVPADAGPVVQRTVEIDEISTTVEPAGAAAAAQGAASAGGSGGGQDYEEIADRVYDRIRTRFATELLLDRERMGLLIDG